MSSLTATSGPVAQVLQPSPGPRPEMRGTTPGASCCLQQKDLFAGGTSISPNPGGPGGTEDYILNQVAAVAQNGPITAHFPQRPSMPTALASEGCHKKLPEMATYRKRNMPSPSSGGHTSEIRAGRWQGRALSEGLGGPFLLFQLPAAPAAPGLAAAPLPICVSVPVLLEGQQLKRIFSR